MLLLELQDDEHDFRNAFLMWCIAVGCLVAWTRYLQRRDAAAIDPAAAANVNELRERMHRQRSGVAQADGEGRNNRSSAAPAAAAAGASAPAGAAGERGDCPICLDKVSWPIDTNCSHCFCAQCFMSYHEQGGGMLRPMVTCPCCRRKVDMVLPSEPGWTAEERESAQGRKLAAEVTAYNERFSGEPRSWAAAARDAPHLLSRFWSELTSGGPNTMRLLQQLRIWGLMLGGLLYLLSPLDMLPEGLFGLIGLLDDVMVLVVLGIMVAGVFRNVMLQRAAQAM